MKILFVGPTSEILYKRYGQYPLGLLYLASVLIKAGHKVLVKDYFAKPWGNSKKEIIEIIKKSPPDVVGINCVTRNRTSGFDLAKAVKKINPKIKIIMGGVHATAMHEQILLNFPVDVIVLGEGEITTPELVKAFEKNSPLKKIKGIAFKDKGKVISTGCREPIHNLDSIPFPKHELCEDAIKEAKTAYMITSRGCPFGCTFCSTSAYWGRKWRPRSAKNVLEEIEYIMKRFPYVKNIFFHDDTFFVDNKRVIDICEGIIKRGIKIKWACFGRVDRVSKEMLVKMKEAGCVSIDYGVESGSPKILKSIEKNITREQIKKTIEITNEVGMKYGTFLMVGNPGETRETVKETAEFIKTLKNLDIGESVARLEIYPNTKVYELAKKQGIIDDSFWLTDKKVPHYTFEHSEAELTEMMLYLTASGKLRKGLFNFLIFGIKFFLKEPRKATKYILIKLRILR